VRETLTVVAKLKAVSHYESLPRPFDFRVGAPDIDVTMARSPFGLPEATAVVRPARLSGQSEGKATKIRLKSGVIWGISAQ